MFCRPKKCLNHIFAKNDKMVEELGDIRREYNIKSIEEKILPDKPFKYRLKNSSI